MDIVYTIQIWQEGNTYVGHVPEFDVSSCGKTADEAKQNTEEAFSLFLEEAEKIGTLQQILEESGYQRQNGKWKGPHFVAIEEAETHLA